MGRKKYICGGCGKETISGKLPHGWKKICDSPDRCICDLCRAEKSAPAIPQDELRHSSIAFAKASSVLGEQ
ncbi:MAG: hypothetical protein U9R10_03280 [Euryarchaeota archaeon]|nr:hypothetical protein [Euryarchaeota archaeon]